jgi:L-iditol 2-dehydrogenase
MKAVRMYKPGDLRVEDVPVPKAGDDETLVKVIACGVCGSDIPRVNRYGAHIAPLTIGHEFSGEIVETGKNVKGFVPGDIVAVPPLMPCRKCEWCLAGEYSLCDHYDYFGSRRDGAMAEYVPVPQANLLKITPEIDPVEAATFDPCANAMHAIGIAGLKEGENVSIYGAGPIGLFALQCAKAYGALKVIMVDIDEKKLQIAAELGADHTINSRNEKPSDKIRDILGGGAEVVFDITGAPAAQLEAIESCRKLGRMVLVGISHQPLSLGEKHVDQIMRKQLRVLGSWNSFYEPFPGRDWFETRRLFSEKKVRADKVISHRLTLDEAPGMFQAIDKGGIFFNKILFLP